MTHHTENRIALGAMLFGTTIDEKTSFALLDQYVDGGGVWIDTADCYAFWADPSGFGGQSERLLGRWLAARPGVRDKIKIATKVGCEPLRPGSFPEASQGLGAETISNALEGSLKRMGIDYVDLYWTHRDDRTVDQSESVAAMGALVTEGRVGRIGHSNTALWRTAQSRAIAATLDVAGPTALQLRYSYLQPRPMVRAQDHNHRFGWITDEVLDFAGDHAGTALWAYSPLMSGAYDRADRPVSQAFDHPGTARRLAVLEDAATELGRSRSELVLAWLTGGAPVVTPIVGVSNHRQLDAALSGVRLELDPALRDRLDAAW